MYIMTKLQATVKSHFWFARPSPEMWNSKWIAWVCRCMVCLELHQRWANSVLMNEYEYYSTFKKWPNTDTNIIWFEKSTKYEYRYYSVWKNYPNTNTSIRSQLFKWYLNTELFAYLCHSWGSSRHCSWGPSYEYYSVWKNRPNTNTNIIRFENIDRIRIRILFGLKKSPEYEYEY